VARLTNRADVWTWLNRAANAAIVIGMMAVVAGMVRNQWFPPEAKRPARLTRGGEFPVAGLTLGPEETGIVLVLHPTCKYCTASAPFYRRLIERTKGATTVRVHAVFPPDVDGAAYLRDLDLPIPHSTIDFRTNGVSMTPTLVIVSGEGGVRWLWQGQLTVNQEANVMSRVVFYVNQSRASVSADEALAKARAGTAILVDVRERAQFSAGHAGGALNIPVDELEARAANELDSGREVFLYCDTARETLSRFAYETLGSFDATKVSVVKGGLPALSASR
jgi:rhodanese-related sulfurtransferase